MPRTAGHFDFSHKTIITEIYLVKQPYVPDGNAFYLITVTVPLR
jgi:hypothetical protein